MALNIAQQPADREWSSMSGQWYVLEIPGKETWNGDRGLRGRGGAADCRARPSRGDWVAAPNPDSSLHLPPSASSLPPPLTRVRSTLRAMPNIRNRQRQLTLSGCAYLSVWLADMSGVCTYP